MRTVTTGIVALLMVFAAEQAASETYLCDLDTGNANGWVSERIAFQPTSNRRVLLNDAHTVYFNEGPVEARMRINGNRMRLSWVLRVHNTAGQRARMNYSAQMDRQTLAIDVQASPSDYRGTFRATGTCRIQDG